MSQFQNILVPIDLAECCQQSINLAGSLAKTGEGKLVFCYVALPPLPPEVEHEQQAMDSFIYDEHSRFKTVRPDDLAIEYEHHFLRGNPGPEIVRLAEEQGCDLIVLATHGRRGLARWIMGSVAEYVTRNAKCPVLTLKMPKKPVPASPQPEKPIVGESKHRFVTSPFVTSAMKHCDPVHAWDSIEEVISEMNQANVTAAPVVDEKGKCVGIVTDSDVSRYSELIRRYREKDEDVIPEMFERNKFGLLRTSDQAFFKVQKHMTCPVISISDRSTCKEAEELLQRHSDIHHLIVVDNNCRPIGMISPSELEAARHWSTTQPISTHK